MLIQVGQPSQVNSLSRSGAVAPQVGIRPDELSGLVLWLDGALADTILGTANVIQWDDVSGQNNHATQASILNTPSRAVDGVQFSNSNGLSPPETAQQYMELTSGPLLQVAFIVATMNSGGVSPSAHGLISSNDGSNDTYAFAIRNTDPGTTYAYSLDGTASDVAFIRVNGGFYEDTGGNVGSFATDVLQDELVVLAISYLAPDPANPGMDLLGAIRASSGISLGLDGVMHEVVVYDRTLTVEEFDGVEAYLIDKWRPPTPGS